MGATRTQKKSWFVTTFLTLVLGFVLFNGELANGFRIVLRMNEKNGDTWILWSESGELMWKLLDAETGGDKVTIDRRINPAWTPRPLE